MLIDFPPSTLIEESAGIYFRFSLGFVGDSPIDPADNPIGDVS